MTGHNGNGRGDIDRRKRERELIVSRVSSIVGSLETMFPDGWGFSIIVAPHENVGDTSLLAYGGTLHVDRAIPVLRTIAKALELAGPPPPPSPKPTDTDARKV